MKKDEEWPSHVTLCCMATSHLPAASHWSTVRGLCIMVTIHVSGQGWIIYHQLVVSCLSGLVDVSNHRSSVGHRGSSVRWLPVRSLLHRLEVFDPNSGWTKSMTESPNYYSIRVNGILSSVNMIIQVTGVIPVDGRLIAVTGPVRMRMTAPKSSDPHLGGGANDWKWGECDWEGDLWKVEIQDLFRLILQINLQLCTWLIYCWHTNFLFN